MLPLSLPNKLFKKLDEDKLDEPVVIEQPKGDGNKAIYVHDSDDDFCSDDEVEDDDDADATS